MGGEHGGLAQAGVRLLERLHVHALLSRLPLAKHHLLAVVAHLGQLAILADTLLERELLGCRALRLLLGSLVLGVAVLTGATRPSSRRVARLPARDGLLDLARVQDSGASDLERCSSATDCESVMTSRPPQLVFGL